MITSSKLAYLLAGLLAVAAGIYLAASRFYQTASIEPGLQLLLGAVAIILLLGTFAVGLLGKRLGTMEMIRDPFAPVGK
jgi:predicted ABC-type sugar transport system permease subunit